MISSFTMAIGFFVAQKVGVAVPTHVPLLGTVAVTTLTWIVTAYVTTPTEQATLIAFYRKVRPAGPGWAAIRAATNLAASPDSLPQAFLAWMLGCLTVYAALFGTGSYLYGHTTNALFWLAVFLVSGGSLVRLLPRLWSGAPAE
jgi:hypothetical protein